MQNSNEDGPDFYFQCDHIALVSVSKTECQCMHCLRVWIKQPDFKSDWPNLDKG
jgi:hypothetical protein